MVMDTVFDQLGTSHRLLFVYVCVYVFVSWCLSRCQCRVSSS